MTITTSSARTRIIVLCAVVATVSATSLSFGMNPPRIAKAAGGTVTAPSPPSFSLSTPNQDPGDFVLSGFGASDNLLVSVGFVNPPSGTTFALPTTTGLTPSVGYNFSGGKTQISFTGSMANSNAALAAMTVTTGSTNGTITIRVTASVNVANVFYNPINDHYYEFVSASVDGAAADSGARAKTYLGVRGYLATSTTTQEQDFIKNNTNASNIWIGANDVAVEGTWKWADGPEAGTTFWVGVSNGSSPAGQFAKWCSNEPNNWGSGEDYAVTSWGGGNCWNDYGAPATSGAGSSQGYLVEYSQNWGSVGAFSSDSASAEVTALVDNSPKDVTASRSGSGAVSVSWTAPAAGTVTSYTVTSTPGSKQCTIAAPATTCTVSTLTNGVSYTFVVTATFNDASTKASLPSSSVTADDGSAPTVTLVTDAIRSSASATLRSTETGTGYLVNTSVSVTNLASITGAPGSRWNQVTISSVGSDTSVAATGLEEGTYKAFAVDPIGNLSSASTGTVTVDDTAPTATLSVSSSTSSSASISFRVTGNEAIDCSSLSANENVDFVLVGISSITSIVQTSSSLCTVNAVSTAQVGGAAVVSTLAASGSFSISDPAGNPQTTLVGAPKSITVTVPATTTTSTTSTTIPVTVTTVAPTVTNTTTVQSGAASGATTPSTGVSVPTAGIPAGAVPTLPPGVPVTTGPPRTTPIVTVVPESTTTTTTMPPQTASTTSTSAGSAADAPQAPPAEPGTSAATRDGEPTNLVVTRENNVLTMTSGELAVSMSAVDKDGKVAPLLPDGSIKVEADQKVRATIAGFGGGSDVEMWLMSTPTLLGRSKVGQDGRADAVFRLPSRIEPGKHRLVFKGVDSDAKEFIVSVGITVGGGSTKAAWSRVFVMILLLAAACALFLPAAFRRRRSTIE